MDKPVVIHQPDFMPYLGFFHRFLNARAWVVLDHVQFLNKSKGWNKRDKIKTPQGEKWLTVAVKKAPHTSTINQIMLSDTDWRKENLKLLDLNYRKAPFFGEIMPFVLDLYAYECHDLVGFNMKSLEMLLKLFDIQIEKVFSSNMDIQGTSNEMNVDILKKMNAKSYLSGVGAKAYFDPKPFEDANIEVIWQNFNHPVYPQLYGDFIPYLSSIDLLFNCGMEKSREILRAC